MSTASPLRRIVHILRGVLGRLSHMRRTRRDSVRKVVSLGSKQANPAREGVLREGKAALDRGFEGRPDADQEADKRSVDAPITPADADADAPALAPPPLWGGAPAMRPPIDATVPAHAGAAAEDEVMPGLASPGPTGAEEGAHRVTAREHDDHRLDTLDSQVPSAELSESTAAIADGSAPAAVVDDVQEEPASPESVSHTAPTTSRHRHTPGARSAVQHRERRPARPSGLHVLPARYRAWNRALAEYCLNRSPGATAYLTVTPQILAAAWLEAFHEAKDANDAATDFAAAVSETYKTYVLGEPQRLWVLSDIDDDGRPDSIGFLALSVLAAYEMHADEEAGPNAFYVRLADLLQVDLTGGHPRGFSTQDFEALWHHLHAWTRQNRRAALAMPSDPAQRRFLALPLTHAPLRKMDVEKLPAFFAWASYEAGTRADVDLLGRDLLAWETARSPLSRAGAAALGDDRHQAVAAQVALELEAWDGRVDTGTGRRSASVQLQLDFVRRQPLLCYLARRPSGFPTRFDDGPHVLEAGEEGWYDPLLVPRDAGHELAAGFSWTMRDGPVTLELRRASAAAIALAPVREVTGFVSRRGLAGGLPCAVLCREDLLQSAQDYLSAVAQNRCQPVQHESVPDGWVLFPNVVPLRHEAVPEGLGALEVGFAAEIVPVGGLRLGASSRWLAGAPPTVFIAGQRGGLAPRVDGEEVVLLSDGKLDDGGRLSRPGDHLVEAGATRRRLEVVEPELNAAASASLVPDIASYVVALPGGQEWRVIGAQIGDVAQPEVATTRGALARLTFEPQWALSIGTARGATALCLSDARPRHSAGPSTGSVVLTAEQFRTLDELAESQPEAKVVGVAGELERHGQRAAVVPIVRKPSGALHVLTAEGRLVDATDPSVLHPDSPPIQWASAIYEAGPSPAVFGSALPDVDEAQLADFWAAYYEAARQFEPLLRRLRR